MHGACGGNTSTFPIRRVRAPAAGPRSVPSGMMLPAGSRPIGKQTWQAHQEICQWKVSTVGVSRRLGAASSGALGQRVTYLPARSTSTWTIFCELATRKARHAYPTAKTIPSIAMLTTAKVATENAPIPNTTNTAIRDIVKTNEKLKARFQRSSRPAQTCVVGRIDPKGTRAWYSRHASCSAATPSIPPMSEVLITMRSPPRNSAATRETISRPRACKVLATIRSTSPKGMNGLTVIRAAPARR